MHPCSVRSRRCRSRSSFGHWGCPTGSFRAPDARMEMFQNLDLRLQRRGVAPEPLYCFLGVFVGTVIGVLPGIGPLATIAMLLPLTFMAAAGRARSSCSQGSTTARSTAARPRRSPQPAGRDRRRSSPASTATRWPSRAGPGRRWRSRRSARSSPACVGTLLIALVGPPLA